MRRHLVIFLLVTLSGAPPAFSQTVPRDWHAVHTFLYQLQNADADAIAAAPFDLVVVDISEIDSREAVEQSGLF